MKLVPEVISTPEDVEGAGGAALTGQGEFGDIDVVGRAIELEEAGTGDDEGAGAGVVGGAGEGGDGDVGGGDGVAGGVGDDDGGVGPGVPVLGASQVESGGPRWKRCRSC